MRNISLILIAGAYLLSGQNRPEQPHTLRDVLLEQLRTTHDKQDWFVPVSVAVDGLTAEQAKWTDGHGNHSIGQLVNHLAFWDARALQEFKGEKPAKFNGNNDETFNEFDSKSWSSTVDRVNSAMKGWEQAVTEASDAKVAEAASLIAHVGTHNAYHIGQILYLRKLQGSWNSEKGVK